MAKLIIFERETGDVTILDLNGDITFGDGSVELRKTIRRLLSEGKKNIHLNFQSVGYVDSSGIGELISSFIAINREDGELKLLNPSLRVKELLAICKLLSIFEICEEEKLFVNYK
jgi:anti-sigma B factor antagonist